jgi:hypothetical protein
MTCHAALGLRCFTRIQAARELPCIPQTSRRPERSEPDSASGIHATREDSRNTRVSMHPAGFTQHAGFDASFGFKQRVSYHASRGFFCNPTDRQMKICLLIIIICSYTKSLKFIFIANSICLGWRIVGAFDSAQIQCSFPFLTVRNN